MTKSSVPQAEDPVGKVSNSTADGIVEHSNARTIGLSNRSEIPGRR